MLLTLPVEIRDQILRYLLLSAEPLSRVAKVTPQKRSSSSEIFSQRNDIVSWHFTPRRRLDLHPQILAANRQLHAEGRDYLYDNKVVVYVAQSYSTNTQAVDVLGRSWVAGLWRFRELEFRVYVDFTRGVGVGRKCCLRELCEKLSAEMGANGRVLGNVRVDAWDGSFKRRYWEDAHEWKRELAGLALLRCRGLAVGDEVPPDCKAWLEEVMIEGEGDGKGRSSAMVLDD